MIGHIEHGGDFGGLFRYLLAQDKGARIIGGLAAGRNALELTQEFNNCADGRRTTTKPVKHFIVSFSPEDGFVPDEVKAKIAEQVVRELGYSNNQYLVVDHHRNDPGHDWHHDHDHIHVVANMITFDGQRVDDWQDKKRFEKILRRLEREENLTLVTPSQNRSHKALPHGQIQRLKREIKEFKGGQRTNEPEIPQMIRLQAAIDAVCEDKPDLATMVGRLQHLGIDVRPTISDKGRRRISYALGELKVRGSKLHHASFPKLIKERGLDFNLSRDRAVIEAVAQGQKISIASSKLIDWQEISFTEYLPSAIKNSIPSAKLPILEKADYQKKLAQLARSCDPKKVNTYLSQEKLKIKALSESAIEIQIEDETFGYVEIFRGFLHQEEWIIDSPMTKEFTKKLIDVVEEAIQQTQHLKIEPEPESQKQKSRGFER